MISSSAHYTQKKIYKANMRKYRHLQPWRSFKIYILCTLSQEANRGCAPPKQESKPRKRKTWDLRNKKFNI